MMKSSRELRARSTRESSSKQQQQQRRQGSLLWKGMKRQRKHQHQRTCSGTEATALIYEESVSSLASNSVSANPSFGDYIAPEALVDFRLQLTGLSSLASSRTLTTCANTTCTSRQQPSVASRVSCPVSVDEFVDEELLVNSMARLRTSARRSSGPVDLDDFCEEEEEEPPLFTTKPASSPLFIQHQPVSIDDSGPIDVDDYIPDYPIPEANAERESSSSSSGCDYPDWMEEDEDDAFSRSLMGYEEGFEPPVENDDVYFPSHIVHQHRQQQQQQQQHYAPWDDKYLTAHKNGGGEPAAHRGHRRTESAGNSTISSKSFLFEC